MRAALASVLAGSFCACASFSTMKTARAIDPGTSQFSLMGGAVGASVPNAFGDNLTRAAFAPQFELAWRYGIVEGLDLGMKLSSLGGEVNSTISLVRSAGFDLALAPAAGVTGYSFLDCPGCVGGGNNVDVWEFYLKVPLLFGIRFGPHRMHEIVLGPELVPLSVSYGSNGTAGVSQTALLIGGVFGVSLKLSPWLRIQPEVTILTPVGANFDLPNAPLYDRFGATNAIFYQLGLGFAWGNDGFERPRYTPPRERYYERPPPQRYAPPPQPEDYPPQPQYVQPPPPPRQPDPPRGERQDT